MPYQRARGPGPEWFAHLDKIVAQQKAQREKPTRPRRAASHCRCCSQRSAFDVAEPRFSRGINIPPPDWLSATFVIDPKELLADVRTILNEHERDPVASRRGLQPGGGGAVHGGVSGLAAAAG